LSWSLRTHGRILYVSSVDVSLGNGPAVNEIEFVLALHELIGERAQFCIPEPEHALRELPRAACTFVRPHHRHSLVPFAFHALDQLRTAKRLLAERPFDLMVFRLAVVPLVPLLLTRGGRVPYAFKTLGATTLNVLQRIPVVGRFFSSLNRRIMRPLVTNAILCDAASLQHVEILRAMFAEAAERIVWIDNTVNTKRFFPKPAAQVKEKLGLSRFDPIVGYVGNLPWERGGLQLVEVAARLRERHPKLGVVILGDGEGRQALARRAAELGVQDSCVLTGHVPYEQVPDYINALDVGVSFLLPESQLHSEQKVRQYVACGKPVIATTPGGNDFLRDENLGALVAHDDLDAVAREVDRWLRLPDKAGFAARAVQFARDHMSVEQGVERRLDLWGEGLVRAGRRPGSTQPGS